MSQAVYMKVKPEKLFKQYKLIKWYFNMYPRKIKPTKNPKGTCDVIFSLSKTLYLNK